MPSQNRKHNPSVGGKGTCAPGLARIKRIRDGISDAHNDEVYRLHFVPKISAAERVKRALGTISQLDTFVRLVQWLGGLSLASFVSSKIVNPVNPYVPLFWFFLTLFMTVLTVKTLSLCWSKWVQHGIPWLKRPAQGGPRITARAVVDTPTPRELELEKTLQARTSERDVFLEKLKECLVEFSQAKLSWIAERALLNGDTDNVAVVRFATYDDFDLASQIQATIQQNMQWQVELDGTNSPTIRPNSDYKVLFESDHRATFDEIAAEFISGHLLDNVRVGIRRHDAVVPDTRRLVVEIAPTVKR